MNLFRRLFALAFNHSPTALAYGCASNICAEPIGKDSEWLKLSPYFEGDYWEREGQDWKRYKQVVTKAHGDRLVAAINAIRADQGESFRGLPIYRGHPDADPQRWPDESRLGGVLELEARADGIYAKVAWNDEGERNRAQGYLVYPSPAWPYDLALKRRSGRIEPVELRSIGMTNTPRISGVPAWTNAEPNDSPEDETTNTTDTIMKEKLLKLLGLPETATDEEIDAAIAAHTDKQTAAANAMEAEKQKAVAACSDRDAAQRERDTAVNALTAAEKTGEKFRTLAINALVTDAINSGKISAAEQAGIETKLATNFDDAAAELKAKQPTLNTEALKITKRTDDISTPAGRTMAFNSRLDELMRGEKACRSIDEAIAVMRATPADAELLKAMEQAA